MNLIPPNNLSITKWIRQKAYQLVREMDDVINEYLWIKYNKCGIVIKFRCSLVG